MNRIKLFENFDKSDQEFEHLGRKFKIQHIHTNMFRVIYLTNKYYKDWFNIEANNETELLDRAKSKIDKIFSDGEPLFSPRGGEKFKVTGEFLEDNGNVKKVSSIGFRTGAHSRNPGGTDSFNVKPGQIITFDREGEDDGFWYLGSDKKTELKGSKPWSLLMSGQIKSA